MNKLARIRYSYGFSSNIKVGATFTRVMLHTAFQTNQQRLSGVYFIRSMSSTSLALFSLVYYPSAALCRRPNSVGSLPFIPAGKRSVTHERTN